MSVHIDNTPPNHDDDTQQLSNIMPRGNIKGLIIIAVAAIIAIILDNILTFDENTNRGLAILAFVAILWLTEAVHITITALMVPLLAIFSGITNIDGNPVMNTQQALANFANPIIFVFFGGFALATALHVQKIDRKIAYSLIMFTGGNMKISIIMLFLVTAFLSMWISNTATAAMMLPLAIGLMGNLDRKKYQKTYAFVLLGIAYSASIGGIGAIVGSPPNGIAAQALNLDFNGWMKYGLPVMLATLPLMIFSLYVILRPKFDAINAQEFQEESIPMTPQRWLTVIIFTLTAIAWIFGSKLAKSFGFNQPDAVIALTAAVSVAVLGLASWRNISDNTDWGVLMLFGGGITLSKLIESSGAAGVLGQTMATFLSSTHPIICIFVVASFIIFLTEITSNTAAAALLVPIFASVASTMGMPKEVLVMVIGIGASMAFMLPVATPPNAIVFGTGLITQRNMMQVGFLLNILCILLVTFWAYFFLM